MCYGNYNYNMEWKIAFHDTVLKVWNLISKLSVNLITKWCKTMFASHLISMHVIIIPASLEEIR